MISAKTTKIAQKWLETVENSQNGWEKIDLDGNKFVNKKKTKTTKTWLKMVGNEWKEVKIERNKNVMA